MPAKPSTWVPEAIEIVQENWEKDHPWEIAHMVNIYHRNVWYKKVMGNGGVVFHKEIPFTSFHGGGVVYRAWQLGLVETREKRDELRKWTAKMSTSYLTSPCEHDKFLKDCLKCYVQLPEIKEVPHEHH